MKVLIIGGGPAGMMSAIEASKNKNEVILIEKNKQLGKKLLITGKGRCNITSSLDISDFIKNIPGNGKFLYSSFENFSNIDMINFLKKNGLQVKEERGNRIFPVTDKSIDVLKCFEKELKKQNVKIILNEIVQKIILNKEKTKIEGVITNKQEIKADKIVIATGGMSYNLTGSTGDGYRMAKEVGHTITDINPSLVPLTCYKKQLCEEMQGLSLKNVKINIIDTLKKKKIYEDFGEMLFTHFGVSGPIILSGSAHLIRYKNIKQLLKDKKIVLTIDLKPALSYEKLDERILRDFEQFKNKKIKNSLEKLLPQKMINPVIKVSGIDSEKKVNEIKKEEREYLVKTLKEFKLEIKDFRPIDEAIITSGGISIKEVNPSTMESKLIKGLYFAGEVLDVDAYTGGFNLQIAYSTGYTARNVKDI